jgi:hypothetical protein
MTSSSDAEFLKRAGVTSLDDPQYEKHTRRLRRLRDIRNYVYVMHLLERDLSYPEVAEIFVRVNSLGVKLRGSDLALAQITARWRNSLALLEGFQEECDHANFTLDLGLLVRAMVVFATGQSRFDTVSKLSEGRLQEGWELAKEGLRFAINFLRANAGLEDESLLSSPLFLIAIAALTHQRQGELTREDEARLLEWVYVGSGRGRYSRGSSETALDEDLATIRRGEGPDKLIETLRRQFGRLRFEASDFEGRNARSPVFPLVYLALRRRGAKDWRTGLAIDLHHHGRAHVIQYHHIFPKARLKDRYEPRLINEIANMAFVSGRTNRQLYTDLPEAYFPGVIGRRGEDALVSQCVSLEPRLRQLESFPQFVEVRRAALADAVNNMIDSTASRPLSPA